MIVLRLGLVVGDMPRAGKSAEWTESLSHIAWGSPLCAGSVKSELPIGLDRACARGGRTAFARVGLRDVWFFRFSILSCGGTDA